NHAASNITLATFAYSEMRRRRPVTDHALHRGPPYRKFICPVSVQPGKLTSMPLEQDRIYMTPDGRRFRAELDTRWYRADWSCTTTPVHASNSLSRDVLERMLFLRRDRVFRLNFMTPELVVDTGWTADDLRCEG